MLECLKKFEKMFQNMLKYTYWKHVLKKSWKSWKKVEKSWKNEKMFLERSRIVVPK
jgi:hypothetical protein